MLQTLRRALADRILEKRPPSLLEHGVFGGQVETTQLPEFPKSIRSLIGRQLHDHSTASIDNSMLAYHADKNGWVIAKLTRFADIGHYPHEQRSFKWRLRSSTQQLYLPKVLELIDKGFLREHERRFYICDLLLLLGQFYGLNCLVDGVDH